MPAIPNTFGTGPGPAMCREHNVPADHARRFYGCPADCGCSAPEPDPHAQVRAWERRQEAERQRRETVTATHTTHTSDPALREANRASDERGLQPAPDRAGDDASEDGTPNRATLEDVGKLPG